MKKTATLIAGAIVTLFLAYNGAFAQPPATHNLQSGKPPTDIGGARARAFDIQNGTMWNRDQGWWIYQSQTGTYFNPRTGVTCTGKAPSATCF